MKKGILLLLILFIATSCRFGALRGYSGNYQPPETTRYYDGQGHYTGKSEQRGNIIRYYNEKGQFVGVGRIIF